MQRQRVSKNQRQKLSKTTHPRKQYRKKGYILIGSMTMAASSSK